jgi:hypothetical protein
MRTDLKPNGYEPAPEPPPEPAATGAERERPRPITLTQAKRLPEDHADMLFRRRVLKRGETWLLTGPTGIGKSVIAVESAIHWSLGREFLGFDPLRPLSSVIFVAEDDEDEMAWFRDGIFKRLDLDEADEAMVGDRVRFIVCGDLTGADFVAKDLRPALETLKPDLAHLNPALAFIGAEASDQEATGAFLRGQWQPAIKEFRCGGFVSTHTPKASAASRKIEKDKLLSDYSYAVFGSSEWSNFPRGILVIEPTATPGLFRFIAPKRGQRLAWTDSEGSHTLARFLKHATAPGTLGWVDAEANEVPKSGRRRKHSPDQVLGLLAGRTLKTVEWAKLAHDELGVSRSVFFDVREELQLAKRIGKSSTSEGWYAIQQASKN